MGRRCAWCTATLPSHGSVWSPGSEAICRTCYDELGVALARSGLRFKDRPTHPKNDPGSDSTSMSGLEGASLPGAG
jgi:hypothetical protein